MTRQSRAWVVWLVALALIVGAGFRFYRIETQSLWHDEGNSAAMVGRSPDQIAQAAAADIHPPLYYWLLAAWGLLAGKSEMALRFPSTLAGVIAIAVVYQIGARLFSRAAGALAGLLVAISPFQVYYGQEARMYAMLALLSAASILMTNLVLELPGQMIQGRASRGRNIAATLGYVLVNAAGLYTHYTFPAVIVAETIVFLLWLARRRSKWHGLAIWGGLQVGTLLLFLPWLPTAIRQFESWPRLASGPVDSPTVARTLFYGTTLSVSEMGIGALALSVLAVIGLFPALPAEGRRYLSGFERMALVGAWLVAPLIALALLGAIREPALKFLLPCQLALFLLVGRGAALGLGLVAPPVRSPQGRSALSGLFPLLMLLVGLYPVGVGLQNLYFNPAYARDDYRAIARLIREESGPQAAVILVAPNQREVFTYYYPEGPGVTPLPNDAPIKTVISLVESNPVVYAVFWATEEQDPTSQIEKALQRRAYVAATMWVGDVRLVTFLAPDAPSDAITHPTDIHFGNPVLVKLAGYNTASPVVRPGDALGVTLFWQGLVPLDARLHVFVHLIAPDGSLVAQHDGEPRGGLSPTDTWLPDALVMDNHGLRLLPDLPPGDYSLRVGLYLGGLADRLPALRDGLLIGDSVEIQRVTVTAP